LDAPRPMTAFVGTLYVGTDRLGRPLTNAEKRELAAVLRANDFEGASMVALRFAYKKTRSRSRAQDLLGRVNLRLVRGAWDPREVPLTKRMCRLVWSEYTHEVEHGVNAQKAEEMFLALERADGRSLSKKEVAAAWQRTPEDEPREPEQLESLRAVFRGANDEVNLLWLDYQLQGIEEPAEMARKSGRDVKEFYLATDRRKRHVQRLLAETRGVGPKNKEDR
jgi:hypothetical protein